ncbi:MAG TPA: glutamate synthase [Candidatus Agathobaculum stercoravium]|nr:glutamate synthase [Candidatus Agathobaculum stercoravium]
MTTVQAGLTYYKQVNEQVRSISDSEITIENAIGQRYLGCGSSGKKITIHGTPGNGLGQYLNGSTLEVFGNAQEAVGDTMNDGDIIIHGSVGDACGYGMRGGRIFIEGNCGYRGGIHMKAYEQHFPAVVIGGKAGSFLGEYQAGGLILVLGIGLDGTYPVNNFCGTGMHGGKIVLRCDKAPEGLPRQVLVSEAAPDDLEKIAPYIEDYCRYFGGDAKALLAQKYYVLSPNPEAGYHQLYTYES